MSKKTKVGDTFKVRPGPNEQKECVLGPDIDLEQDIVLDNEGSRITQGRAQEMVDAARQEYERRAGRPSLTGSSEQSPHISFRVPKELAERAEAVANREGKSLSQLGREALARYLEKAG
jgi:predicted HicB family RNase H-like nuclease